MTRKAIKPGKRTLAGSAAAALLAGLLLTAAFIPLTVRADTILVPDIELKTALPEKLTRMKARVPTGDASTPSPYMEMPPVVFGYTNAQGEQTVKHHISTGSSYAINVKPGKSFMTDADAYDFSSIRQDTGGVVTWQDTFTDEQGNPTHPQPGLMDPDHSTLWRRVYYGSMGGAVAKTPDGSQDALLVFMHGENKNGFYGSEGNYQYTTNTVQNWGTWETPAEGTTPIPEGYEFDQVYFGFIGLTWSAVDDMDGNNLMDNDMGPIVWPSGGYIEEGTEKPLTLGVRHPYAIEKDGYIYLYYVEDQYTVNRESGRNPGLKVARAPVDNYGPGSWKTWYNGEWTEDALPAGFDKTDRDFVYQMGGRSDVVLQPSSGFAVQRFTVAKLTGTDYYLGVSWDRSQNVALHLSKDLVNWEESSVEFLNYGWATLCYPQLYNADCSSTSEVDPEDFWIIGTDSSKGAPTAVGTKLSIDIKMVEKEEEPGPTGPIGGDGDDDYVDSGNYTDTIAERFDINTDPIPDPEGVQDYISRNPVPKVQGERGYRFVYYPLTDGADLDYAAQKDMVLIEANRRWRWTMPKTEVGDKEAALWDWVCFTTSKDYAAALQFAAPKSGKYHFEYLILQADSSSEDNPAFNPVDGSGDGVLFQWLDKDGKEIVPSWDGDDFYACFVPEDKPTTMEGWNDYWRELAHIVEFDMVLKKGETVTMPVLAKDSKQFDNVYFLSNIGRYATVEELAGPTQPSNPSDGGEQPPAYVEGPVSKVFRTVEEVQMGTVVNFGDAEIVIEPGQIPLENFQKESRVVFSKLRTVTDSIRNLKLPDGTVTGGSLATYVFRMEVVEDGKTTAVNDFGEEVLFALQAGYDWEFTASKETVPYVLRTDQGVAHPLNTRWDADAGVLSYLSDGTGRFTVWVSGQGGSDVATGYTAAALTIVLLLALISLAGTVILYKKNRSPVR